MSPESLATEVERLREIVDIVRKRRARFAANPYAFSHPRSPEEERLDALIAELDTPGERKEEM